MPELCELRIQGLSEQDKEPYRDAVLVAWNEGYRKPSEIADNADGLRYSRLTESQIGYLQELLGQ